MVIFTSGRFGAGTKSRSLYIGLQLYNHVIKYVQLYNRPGNDFEGNKGDIWKLSAKKFGRRCISKGWLRRVMLMYRGGDDLIIQSVITKLGTSKRAKEVLTSNMHVERKMSPKHRYFLLSKVR